MPLLRAYLLCFFTALIASPIQAKAEHYRVNSMSSGLEATCQGMSIVVLTATQTEKELALRVGILNGSGREQKNSRPIKAEDITLTTFVNAKRERVAPTSITFTDYFPDRVMQQQEMHTGVMTFPWGTDTFSAEALGTMELSAAGFSTNYVSLNKDKVFTPIDWPSVARLSQINLPVIPKTEHLSVIPMRLHSMTVDKDIVEFTISFRNANRLPIQWHGGLSGGQARLISEHGEIQPPSAVSETLQTRIAPPGETWSAGEDNLGWVRFPLPHPEASHHLGFLMPGYGISYLSYDEETRTWQPALVNKIKSTPPVAVTAKLDEEHTFELLKAFWADATKDLNNKAWSTFLKRFRGGALADQKNFIQQWQHAPISSASFRLSEFQSIQPDTKGRQRNVRVELRYTIAGLPKENLFVTSSDCDMQRDEDGQWHVDFIGYSGTQPFWVLGYTECKATEHFLIFHRADEENAKQADLAGKQLEKSYLRLIKTGLHLQPRYAAFSIAVKNDFEKLTGRDPLTFSGGASSGYMYQKGGVTVVNQALYLNDYRFFTLQRAWGKQDRQVTILHELVHLALADATRPWTPAWLCEGTAMHFADQIDSTGRAFLRANLATASSMTDLTKISYLGATKPDPHDVHLEYQMSAQAVAWIVKNYGEAGLLSLYSAFATNIPEEWKTYRGDSNNSLIAASRLRITKRILDKVINGLTLEALDTEVRRAIGK